MTLVVLLYGFIVKVLLTVFSHTNFDKKFGTTKQTA